MSDVVSKLFRKSGLLAISMTLIISALTAGVVLFAQPATVSAVTKCPTETGKDKDTDIIYGGLSGGSDVNSLVASLKSHYDSTDGGNGCTDVNTIYDAAHLKSSMFNSGEKWEIAYSMNDGTVVDDKGNVIATNVQVAGRCWGSMDNCQPASKYTKLASNAYLHSTAWFTNGAHDNRIPTLVHIDKTTGGMDFGVWKDCGNALVFTAKLPHKLYCADLQGVPGSTDDNSVEYTFTVTASVLNYPDFTYHIDYGDSSQVESADVTGQPNGNVTHQFKHTYTRLDTDTTYTVHATINKLYDTGNLCVTSFKIPAKNKLAFACQSLDESVLNREAGAITYRFVANVSGTDKPGTYQFFFSDSTQQPDKQSGNTIDHTFNFDISKSQTFSAYVLATSQTGLVTEKVAPCTFSFTTETHLTQTGPASTIGIFTATSAGGIALHQLVLRRKLRANV